MNPVKRRDYKFKGAGGKLITADLSYSKYSEAKPICVFAHGFKGFKDWGAWPLAAEIFAVKGLPFFKFNFSQNGTSPEKLNEFSDLEAFGNNNFKLEYEELGLVLDFIEKKAPNFDFAWDGQIYLIGHSRGGGIALLRAANDERISKCCTWSSVSDLERYLEMKDFHQWKADGVHYIENKRTRQEMPVYFQFVETFAANAKLLNLSSSYENIVCPLLIIHGEDDTVVPISDAHVIYDEVLHSILVEIENTDHTYGMKHPLTERKISKAFAEVVSETTTFFQL